MKKALITGSAGLIGSEAVRFFCSLGFEVIGVDNNMRAYFFGDEASTDWNRRLLEDEYDNYTHYKLDIRDEDAINELFEDNAFDLIIHTAAQPSHDWAAKEPLTDFSVNATGTLILLEAFRKYSPEGVFIFTSTNKVYGDAPNRLPLIEKETRYEIDPVHKYRDGIDETMSIDQSKHSIFGASKVAADVLVQEYGRYFDLYTGVFRGGCLTGPAHSGTELHGFLAYLVKCIAEGRPYTIFGYKGKQVRDNIHSADLINMFYEFYKKPRIAEVYNAGGSRHSNVSMMEAIEKIEGALDRKGDISYSDENRKGDHIWYISDVSKFKDHYPDWEYTYDIDDTIEEICRMGHFSKPVVGNVVVSEFETKTKPEVFVASHVTEMFGPVQALKAYLVKNYSSFVFVEHPFTYSKVSHSKVNAFRGSLVSKSEKTKKAGHELISYLQHFIFTIYWYLRRGRTAKYFIGIDALNAFAGLILKKLGADFDLIYYSVDYSPHRFKNKYLNSIYRKIDEICAKNADFVWNVTERIRQLRKSMGVEDSKNKLVPNGVYLEHLPRVQEVEKNLNTLVVVDHLVEEKNIQTIIKALNHLKDVNSDAKLVIIGSGPYEQELKDLVSEHDLDEYVEFVVETDPARYLSHLPSYGIGLSAYKGDEGSSEYYSDPVTPKEMLAAGLPVVVPEVLHLSSKVDEKKMGHVISSDPHEKEIVEAVRKMWNDDQMYRNYSKNATKYGQELSWYKIFEQYLSKDR